MAIFVLMLTSLRERLQPLLPIFGQKRKLGGILRAPHLQCQVSPEASACAALRKASIPFFRLYLSPPQKPESIIGLWGCLSGIKKCYHSIYSLSMPVGNERPRRSLNSEFLLCSSDVLHRYARSRCCPLGP